MITNKLTLYNLVDQYKVLLDLDSTEYQTAVEELQGQIAEKAENVALVIKTFEANMLAVYAEMKRLQTIYDSYAANATWLKNYLQRELEAAQMLKIQGTLANISLQKAPMSVEITCETDIPDYYMRVIPPKLEPNKKLMLDEKRADNALEIPGVKFITNKRTLQIK